MSLSVPTTPLCPEFTVCGQISLHDVEVLARQGYRSIINNRPDGEGGPDQPTSAALQAAAQAHGMRYVHVPVPNLMLSAEQVAHYQQVCADLPHPIVAFCRSGGRASALFQACGGQVGKPA
ncbi:MAG: TIGR01244 family sulfur transferase [Aquabacterium sp.]